MSPVSDAWMLYSDICLLFSQQEKDEENGTPVTKIRDDKGDVEQMIILVCIYVRTKSVERFRRSRAKQPSYIAATLSLFGNGNC